MDVIVYKAKINSTVCVSFYVLNRWIELEISNYKEREREREREREKERQTDRQTDRQTEKEKGQRKIREADS